MKILFVTSNEDKMREIREILTGLPLEIQSLREAGLHPEIVEDGGSFQENALIKVRALPLTEDVIFMADDSGLSIDALGGKPGIYSSRFLGEKTPYPEKHKALLELLQNVPEEKRTARYTCAVAVRFPDGTESVSTGTMEGRIAFEPKGHNGFGYDPLFFFPPANMTAAEMTEEAKNAESHRFKALSGARNVLRDWLKKQAEKR